MNELMTRKQRPRALSFFNDLGTDFDRFFDFRFPMLSRLTGDDLWRPKLDIFEKKGKLTIEAELPGMKKKDVHVAFEEGGVTLSGERKDERKVEEDDFYHSERSYGSFRRWLPLDFEVDPAKVDARFEDGVLRISIPIPPEKKTKAREIEIH